MRAERKRKSRRGKKREAAARAYQKITRITGHTDPLLQDPVIQEDMKVQQELKEKQERESEAKTRRLKAELRRVSREQQEQANKASMHSPAVLEGKHEGSSSQSAPSGPLQNVPAIQSESEEEDEPFDDELEAKRRKLNAEIKRVERLLQEKKARELQEKKARDSLHSPSLLTEDDSVSSSKKKKNTTKRRYKTFHKRAQAN